LGCVAADAEALLAAAGGSDGSHVAAADDEAPLTDARHDVHDHSHWSGASHSVESHADAAAAADGDADAAADDDASGSGAGSSAFLPAVQAVNAVSRATSAGVSSID
jgi:hypothetical protein